MLIDGWSSADLVLRKYSGRKKNGDLDLEQLRDRRSGDYVGDCASHEVTLLNGEMIGALTMKIVIGNAALRLLITENVKNGCGIEAHQLKEGIEESMEQLLEFANKYIIGILPSGECELMHGRSGYLKAIKFIQNELSDSNFGRDAAVRKLLGEIWEEGNDVGGGKGFLLWKYKQKKIDLGALHGIAGILHTLLDFNMDLASALGGQKPVEAWNPDDVKDWLEKTNGSMPDDMGIFFRANEISGKQLLTFGIEDLKLLGIDESRVVHLLLDEIKKLETASNVDLPDFVEATVMKMNDWQLKGGNLAPSLKSPLPTSAPKKYDKLVQVRIYCVERYY
jgi:hypothetical protein